MSVISRDAIAPTLEDALDLRRHDLRRVPDETDRVACRCGLFSSPDLGPPAARAWRDHLTRVAIEAIEGIVRS